MAQEPEKFGPYFVYELLGRGGMATVHRAESLSAAGFRKRVALKRLLPQLAEDPEFVESFTREAKLASHLRHVNIATTYDLGIVDDHYYIAMEFVPGPTLRQVVKQCDEAAGVMPIKIALDIVIQTCEALEYAHGLVDDGGQPFGIVHRDVTPANIIVSSAGVVKLIDFGLAKVSAGRDTKQGILKGKLGYMAPEYTLGVIDARADLFAVGVILHELLTGRRLFDHDNEFEIIKMLREMPIQPPSRWRDDVTRDLDDVVMTALARNPGNRWQSATALRSALTNIAREQGLAISHDELAKWTEWAFSQVWRREESGLARVIDGLGETTGDGTLDLSLSAVTIMPTPSPASPSPAAPSPAAPMLTPSPPSLVRAKVRSVAPAPGLARASSDVETRPRIPVKHERTRWTFVVAFVIIVAAAAIYLALPYLK